MSRKKVDWRAFLRVLSVPLVGGVLWLVYANVTKDQISDVLGTGALWVGYVLTGLILFAIFAEATQLLFASIDKLLRWIHPTCFGPWYRWHGMMICAVMLGCAVAIALALNSALVLWIKTALITAATTTLGEASGNGIIGSTLAWIKSQLTNLLSPYLDFAILPWRKFYGVQWFDHWAQPTPTGWFYLPSYGAQWFEQLAHFAVLAELRAGFDHWAQPLAFCAGLLAWLFRRRDEGNRLRMVSGNGGKKAETTTSARRTCAQLSAVAAGSLVWCSKRSGEIGQPTNPRAHSTCEPSKPPSPRKRIIIHCDGTSNSPKQKDGDVEVPTNVYRLHQAVTRFGCDELPQISIYDEGVGTDTSRQSSIARRIKAIAEFIGAKRVAGQAQKFSKLRSMLELAFGVGITENIEQGYREIVRIYEPGDEIWLLGFSRGAYTARCIAGVIARCGLLKTENIRFVPDAITLYLRRGPNDEKGLLAADLVHGCEVKIKFMGLWDTVGSLGIPLWGWWFRVGAFGQNQGFNNSPARICENVYQALSIDETRSQFMPTLAEKARNSNQVIEQVWFRGGHAEVGGGYAEHELADLALNWMVLKAEIHNLGVDRVKLKLSTTDPKLHPFAPIKTAVMRNPRWALFGTWPRWHPVTARGADAGVQYGALGDCVWDRSDAATKSVEAQFKSSRDTNCSEHAEIDDRAASDGFVLLQPGQSASVTIRADRIWNRTGIVFESGNTYAISEVGGEWRDKECRPCGARGDELAGLDLFRRLGAWARRSPAAEYCALIGHVAHPRSWDVLEFGFFKLIGFFLIRDPWSLRASLIDIGGGLQRKTKEKAEKHGVCVSIRKDCPSGVFYAFANDLWTTYANNSGSVTIKIMRLKSGREPDFTITERGEVKKGVAQVEEGDKKWTQADARVRLSRNSKF